MIIFLFESFNAKLFVFLRSRHRPNDRQIDWLFARRYRPLTSLVKTFPYLQSDRFKGSFDYAINEVVFKSITAIIFRALPVQRRSVFL